MPRDKPACIFRLTSEQRFIILNANSETTGAANLPSPTALRFNRFNRFNRSTSFMALIEVDNLTKTYHLPGGIDVPVLKGVSLSVEKGDLVALMGASGSGKSTLMNILGFLDTPSGGDYRFDGRDVSRLTSDERADLRAARIGWVFQSFNLLARTSALQNVLMPLEYHRGRRAPRAREVERAKELLAMLGLEGRMDHTPAQLSGGQQQRVAIARSLVNDPEILFADEPTGNLDSKTTVEILELFRRLNAEKGITIVLVTHDAEVCDYTRRTIHVKDGLVVPGVPAAAQSAG